MTIRRFLHRILQNRSHSHPASHEITSALSSRPGIHQPVEESEPVAFSPEDHKFLRQLGIRTSCGEATREHINTSNAPDEVRSPTAARA
jgi:hypothetical protein